MPSLPLSDQSRRPEHISCSQIDLWRSRPEQWKQRYILGAETPVSKEMCLGKAVHSAVEAYHTKRDPVVAYGEAIERERAVIKPEDYDAIRESGFALVSAYIRDARGESVIAPWDGVENPCEVKVEIKVPGVPIPLLGYIDMLSVGPVIRDLKVVKTKYGPAQIRKSLQRVAYWWGVRTNFGVEPREFVFDFLLKDPERPRLVTVQTPQVADEEIEAFIALCQDYWRELSAFQGRGAE
jgi:hypothetical protein